MIKKEEVNNLEVALFALYKLGGITQKIHTERIAFECFNLAKERFSWRLNDYKDYPDKTPVRFALEQAKKKQNGSLVIGKAGGDFAGGEREGWRFTASGTKWIKENEQRIARILKQERPEIPLREAERFIKRIKNDLAFKQYKEDKGLENVNRYNFTDMLSCPPDASIEVSKALFENLRSEAELVKDNEILKFLDLCQQKFLTQQSEKI